jgi:hypothetical protein
LTGGDYEFRTVSYMHLRCQAPHRIISPEWDRAMRELAHLEAYADFGIGCDLPEWEDRANAEDCWREWWKADWVRPERCGGCEHYPCLQTEDCPGGRHYERQVARYGAPIW